jgi:hypothetical protein
MKAVGLIWDITLLLLGGAGLCAGLDRLASAPFLAVLMIIGAMALLLVPAASLCGADLRLDNSDRSSDRSADRGPQRGSRGR